MNLTQAAPIAARRTLLATTALGLTAALSGPAGSALATPAFAASPTALRAAAPAHLGVPAGPVRPIVPRDAVRIVTALQALHRYELVNTASRLRADVMWASTAPTTGVFLWPDNTSRSQEFRLLGSPGGYVRLQAVHSGQCLMLDWRGGRYVNGTRIVQHPDCSAGYAPAEWMVRAVPQAPCTQGAPYFCGFRSVKHVLVNRRTGRCLDVANAAGGRPPARAVLQQWDCVTRDDAWNIGNQGWDFFDLDAPGPRIG